MKPRRASWAIAMVLALGPVALRGQEKPASPEKPAVEPGPDSRDDCQDLLFLGESRPVLFRLRIQIDGEPYRAYHRKVWEDCIKVLFAHADRNGDGRLSADEAARLPQPQVTAPLPPNAQQPIPVNIAFNFRAIDGNGDGSVSPEELGDYQRRYGGSSLQLSLVADPPRGPAVNDALFDRLDQDKDGKLSKDELAAGGKALTELDQDGDELLSPQEITRRPVNPESTARQRRASDSAGESPAFILIGPGDSGSPVAQRLLAKYGTADIEKGLKLSRAAVGLPQSLFASLDADKDGQLDTAELAKFAQRPADLELIIRLGTREKDAAVLEVLGAAGQIEPLNSIVSKPSDGGLVLPLEKLHLEFQVNEGRPAASATARQAIVQQFKDADKDQKGELDRKTAVQRNFFPRQFDLLDQNGDGKLTMQELEEYLEKVQSLQARAFTSSTVLMISGEGQGIFDALDRNRDGRLSARELSALPQLLSATDEDGHLTRDEVPRIRRLSAGLYRASFHRSAAGEPFTPPGLPLLTLDWSGESLAWFRKMDRNGDGDLSRREFLGSREDFDRLDKDGDGLISAEEGSQAKP
jgi:Ca2+-binding EF-hand superfamily protein